MHVLVLSSESASGGENRESEQLADLLDQLGCRVTSADLVPASWAEIAPKPDVIIVDAGDDMGVARRACEALAANDGLADIPILLAVGVPRLAALDFSLGFADFVLRPFVPAEVYARLRQIDFRTSAYGSDELIKVGDLLTIPGQTSGGGSDGGGSDGGGDTGTPTPTPDLGPQSDADCEAFAGFYEQAWRLGLKGCTLFRPNAVTGAILDEADAGCCGLDREGG